MNNLVKIIKIILTPLVLFIVFFATYKTEATNTNSKYLYDEYAWISRSYCLELLLKGDFKNDLWKTYNIDGDPKLTSYIYGLFIYPGYLKEKRSKGKDYDMVRYLIDNNFYARGYFNNPSKEKYDKYLSKNYISWQEDGAPNNTTLASLLKTHGVDFEKTINIIIKARLGAVTFLSLSAVVVYLIFISTFKNFFVSIFMTLLYGFSSLLTKYGLVAYTEPIFLFLFNLLILNFICFFTNKKRRLFIIITSTIICALLNQTKINGVLFLPLIILLSIVDSFGKDIKTYFTRIFLIITLFISVYVISNPFLYSNTVRNIIFQYQWTHDISINQEIWFKSDALLKVKDRINFINESLKNNGNQSLKFFIINNNIFINPSINYIMLFFVIGLIKLILGFIKEKQLIAEKIMFIIFIYFYISLLFYLTLAWDRYIIHMLFFIFYFSGQGILFSFQSIKHLQLKDEI